ncbi:MAG: VOC family protein, partial [Candidatus Poseidoniaceae archaeon]
MTLRPFHLAFPVDDLEAARAFYTEVLGCAVGRSKPESCVFNLHGHQIVAHRVAEMPALSTNPVDGKAVPAMHFGLVLEWDEWHAMRGRLEAAGQTFVVGPYLR